MRRHDFLRQLHASLHPRNYLEIGVDDGRSLALSRVPTIGIDPDFSVIVSIHCDLDLVKATSDDFFARKDPIKHLRSGRNPLRNLRRGRPPFAHWLGGTSLDFVFIDGMHLFEFALRDFLHVERFAGDGTVVVFDDMLPRNIDEAARDRHTHEWTGDVYKLIPVLRRYRPDLVLLPMDTEPTGVLVVLGLDPGNRVLHDAYDEIVAEWVVPDPQVVPMETLERHGAIDPEALLASSVLSGYRRGGLRRRRTPRIEEARAAAERLARS